MEIMIDKDEEIAYKEKKPKEGVSNEGRLMGSVFFYCLLFQSVLLRSQFVCGTTEDDHTQFLQLLPGASQEQPAGRAWCKKSRKEQMES